MHTITKSPGWGSAATEPDGVADDDAVAEPEVGLVAGGDVVSWELPPQPARLAASTNAAAVAVVDRLMDTAQRRGWSHADTGAPLLQCRGREWTGQ
ncbi:hypothetical protein NLS1_34660 [Nocardioides sp. LS1]|nr:hypothetical protein NLS1_34660 [Nocardioides sp. LS1]